MSSTYSCPSTCSGASCDDFILERAAQGVSITCAWLEHTAACNCKGCHYCMGVDIEPTSTAAASTSTTTVLAPPVWRPNNGNTNNYNGDGYSDSYEPSYSKFYSYYYQQSFYLNYGSYGSYGSSGSTTDEDGDSMLWVILSVAAVFVIATSILGFLIWRKRRLRMLAAAAQDRHRATTEIQIEEVASLPYVPRLEPSPSQHHLQPNSPHSQQEMDEFNAVYPVAQSLTVISHGRISRNNSDSSLGEPSSPSTNAAAAPHRRSGSRSSRRSISRRNSSNNNNNNNDNDSDSDGGAPSVAIPMVDRQATAGDRASLPLALTSLQALMPQRGDRSNSHGSATSDIAVVVDGAHDANVVAATAAPAGVPYPPRQDVRLDSSSDTSDGEHELTVEALTDDEGGAEHTEDEQEDEDEQMQLARALSLSMMASYEEAAAASPSPPRRAAAASTTTTTTTTVSSTKRSAARHDEEEVQLMDSSDDEPHQSAGPVHLQKRPAYARGVQEDVVQLESDDSEDSDATADLASSSESSSNDGYSDEEVVESEE